MKNWGWDLAEVVKNIVMVAIEPELLTSFVILKLEFDAPFVPTSSQVSP